ncbi:hypothetical protein BGZ83_000020 [Gryganskiella cystojenkinii]|nr:hypothetical protein BGZ83_000020 [Gryganskiella cystojenkinii]
MDTVKAESSSTVNTSNDAILLQFEHERKQNEQQRQTLPNECLLLVVDWLFDDLKTLKALLTVSKFLFKAALPLILKNPFVSWETELCPRLYTGNRERLMAFILSSLLQYQVKDRQSATATDETATAENYEVNAFKAILAEFGLRLVQPIRHKELRWTGIELPTVDYSTYYTIIDHDAWRFLSLNELIHLLELPASMRGTESQDVPLLVEMTSPTEESPTEEGDDEQAVGPQASSHSNGTEHIHIEEIHSELQQFDREYSLVVQQSLTRLLLRYNHEYITEWSTNISHAHHLLPFAPKMARLFCLNLSRDEALPDSHLLDMIAFIKQNHAVFPKKPRLRLAFDWSWSPNYYRSIEMATVEEQEKWLRKQLSKIDLYRAVGRPQAMNVDQIPKFYNHCEGIELDRLQEFSDGLMTRYDDGEGPAMTEFLKKCHALQVLKLAVGSPYILSWAAKNALCVRRTLGEKASFCSHPADKLSPPSLIPLKLKNIELCTNRPGRFLIHAINDAATAFSASLQTLNASNYSHHDEEVENPKFISRLKAQRALSVALRSVPEACTIGNWPFNLPHMRTLHIRFSCLLNISIGMLDQCPSLEDLDIDFEFDRRTSHEELESEVRDDPDRTPSSSLIGQQSLRAEIWIPWHAIQPESQQVQAETQLSPPLQSQQPQQQYGRTCEGYHQYFREATSIFPKWTLPRLRTLRLQHIAALRFDYDSLESMKSLENLEIFTSKNAMDYLQFIPRFSAYCSNRGAPCTVKNQTESIRDRDQGPGGAKRDPTLCWTQTWHLPQLKVLKLVGPPAVVFNMDWLRACPRLNKLYLTTWGSPQRCPLSNSSSANDITSSEVSTPFMESELVLIDLKGPWVMAQKDMIQLLTVHAPHLRTLTIGNLSDQDKNVGTNGLRLLETLREADSINRAYIEEHVPEYLELLEEERDIDENDDDGEEERDGLEGGDAEELREIEWRRREQHKDRRKVRSQTLQKLTQLVPGQGLTMFWSHHTVRPRDLQSLDLCSQGVYSRGSVMDENHEKLNAYRVKLGLTGKKQEHRIYLMGGKTYLHMGDRRSWV